MRYKVRNSPKKISASLLSFAIREIECKSWQESEGSSSKAGVARCLKKSSVLFKRTPSRFEMRVYGDFSCESRYESIDGSADSSAGIFVDDLPSNAGEKIGVGSGVPRGLLQLLLVVTRNELVPRQQNWRTEACHSAREPKVSLQG